MNKNPNDPEIVTPATMFKNGGILVHTQNQTNVFQTPKSKIYTVVRGPIVQDPNATAGST